MMLMPLFEGGGSVGISLMMTCRISSAGFIIFDLNHIVTAVLVYMKA
jgi:hypothetical protein